MNALFSTSCPPLAFHSSDSDGHFDTPEEATPVHVPKTFPGELENGSADPHKTGEATAEYTECRKRGESDKGGNEKDCRTHFTLIQHQYL